MPQLLFRAPVNQPAVSERISEFLNAKSVGDFTTIVAVSGGADSVLLLRELHHWHVHSETTGKLVTIHVNHGQRGIESDRDANFVAELCDQLDVPCEIEFACPSVSDSNQQSDQVGSNGGKGLEAILRSLRYAAFERVAAKHGARFIATGHTADDQVETILFRILRGTGIDGLCGIADSRLLNESQTVIRPMLGIYRTEVIEQLRELKQEFRTDESNASNKFTRNRIRNSILPLIRESFGNDVDQSILKLCKRAVEQTSCLTELATPIFESCFQVQAGQIEIDTSRTNDYPPELVTIATRRAWSLAGFPTSDMNTNKWTELTRIIQADDIHSAPPQMFPGQITVHRDGKLVRIVGCN